MQLAATGQSLPFAVLRAMASDAMRQLGRVRERVLPDGRRRWFLDFRGDLHDRGADRFYTFRNAWGRERAFGDADDARDALRDIRARVAEGMPLRGAVTLVLNLRDVDTLELAKEWLAHQRERREVGKITGRSLRQMASDVRLHWPAWRGLQVQRITALDLERWEMRLAKAGQADSTRKRILSTFHSFMVWAERRGTLSRVPPFPEVEVERKLRPTLTWEEQDRVIDEIDAPQRGVFLALAELALRPGEARALDAPAIGPEVVRIYQAAKDYSSEPEIGPTKSGTTRALEVALCPRLMEWAEVHVTAEQRLRREPAFPGPRGSRWGHRDLLDEWRRASKRAGVRYVPLRDATRKTAAREHRKRGAPYELLREYLGHSAIATTEIYAEPGLADLSGLRRGSELAHGRKQKEES